MTSGSGSGLATAADGGRSPSDRRAVVVVGRPAPQAESARDDRRRRAGGLLLTLVLATLPLWEVLAGRRTAMYGDVNDLHVPLVVAAWRNIMNGDAPFWSAATFAGQNMLGSGQSAIFYPVNVLYGMFNP